MRIFKRTAAFFLALLMLFSISGGLPFLTVSATTENSRGGAGSGGNQNDPQTVTLKVTQEWRGDETFSLPEDRPSVDVTVQRSTDGTAWENVASHTLNSANNYTVSLTLPRYDAAGNAYQYKAEDKRDYPGYTTIKGEDETGVISTQDAELTLIKEALSINVKVRQVWNDGDAYRVTGIDGVTPPSVTIYVLKSLDRLNWNYAKEVSLTGDTWESSFVGLPLYTGDLYMNNGKMQRSPLFYKFCKNPDEKIAGFDEDNSFFICYAAQYNNEEPVFTSTPDTLSIKVKLSWVDPLPTEGVPPVVHSDDMAWKLFYYTASMRERKEVQFTETPTWVKDDADGTWTLTIDKLPRYVGNGNAREQIYYTFEEFTPEGYLVEYPGLSNTVSGSNHGSYTIDVCNRHKSRIRMDVKAQSMWNDGQDQYSVRPDCVTVSLLASNDGGSSYQPVKNGDTPVTAVLNEGNQWKCSFQDMPVYGTNGSKITYMVSQSDLPSGYSVSYSDPATQTNPKIYISNTFTATTDIGVTILWLRDLVNEITGDVPTGACVLPQYRIPEVQDEWKALTAEMTSRTGEIILNDENNGSQIIHDVPRYTDAGEPYEYRFIETAIMYGTKRVEGPGNYQVDYSTTIGSSRTDYHITNTAQFMNIQISSHWLNDTSVAAAKRPEKLTFKLHAVAEGSDTELGTFLLSGSDEESIWSTIIQWLPIKNVNGTAYTYYLETVTPEGYRSSAVESSRIPAGDYISHTAQVEFKNELMLPIDVRAEVRWTGDSPEWVNCRPDTLSLQLMYSTDGTNYLPADQLFQNAVLTKDIPANENTVSYCWTGLPTMLSVNGVYQDITYRVEQPQVPSGYQKTATVDASGTFLIENKRIVTDFGVNVQWEDLNNFYGFRPQELRFRLESAPAGTETWTPAMNSQGELMYSLTAAHADAGDENLWKLHIADLPAYDSAGNELKYRAVPENSSLYHVSADSMTGSSAEGFQQKLQNKMPVLSIEGENTRTASDSSPNLNPDDMELILYVKTETGEKLRLSPQPQFQVDKPSGSHVWNYRVDNLPLNVVGKNGNPVKITGYIIETAYVSAPDQILECGSIEIAAGAEDAVLQAPQLASRLPFRLAIDNVTENAAHPGLTDAGGFVGIGSGSAAERDKLDFAENELQVSWRAEDPWTFSPGFRVVYKDFGSDQSSSITVEDISDLRTLNARFPEAKIERTADEIRLILAGSPQKMPFETTVYVSFLPAPAAEDKVPGGSGEPTETKPQDTAPEGPKDPVPDGPKDPVPENPKDPVPDGPKDTVPDGPKDPGLGTTENRIPVKPIEKVETRPLDTVPEGLKNTNFHTIEEIRQAMEKVVLAKIGGQYTGKELKTVIYDVVLMLTENGVTRPAARDEVEARGGITVVIPYPAGTNRTEYAFAVAHMLTVDMAGMHAGDIETPEITFTNAGLQVTLTGLSPVMVGYSKKTAEPASTGPSATEPASAEPTAQEAAAPTAPAEPGKPAPSAGTEDPQADNGSNVLLWSLLALVSVCGIIGIVWFLKKRKSAG